MASALRETGAFPAYMTDMVSLAEETGRLEDVLLSLQRHYDRQLRMAADIRGAVAVPVTLFAVMVAVVVLLVTQVLPVFDRVFAQLGVRMGAVATGMMNAGAVLAKAGTGLAVVLVILAAAALVVGDRHGHGGGEPGGGHLAQDAPAAEGPAEPGDELLPAADGTAVHHRIRRCP